MAKYLQIQIPTRCGESWDTMQQQQQGKFCNSCKKTVIDFTKMSDEQLIGFFKKEKNNVCGRFAPFQLNTDILIPAKKIPWLKYFFQITIPAFLFSTKLMAQEKVKVQQHLQVTQTSGKQAKNLLLLKKIKRFSGVPIEEDKYAEEVLIKQESFQTVEINCSSTEPGTQFMSYRTGGVTSGVRIQREYTFKSLKNTLIRTRVNTNQIFTIYPNPATYSAINIKWTKPVTSNQAIEIYNELGVVVYNEILTTEKNNKQSSLNLKQLQPATYTITITDSKTHKSYSQQIIIL